LVCYSFEVYNEVGGCIGELNHRKFYIFLVFQTIVEIWTFLIAKSGLNQIYVKNPEQGQIIENGQSVEEIVHEENEEYVLFMIIAFISFLAMAFTGLLLAFHTLLIATNQTTWEYTRKDTLNYLRIYPKGFHPFSKGIWENIRMVFFHNNKVKLWELPPPTEPYFEDNINYVSG